MDFLRFLEPDMSIKIFMSLEDPSDFVRASFVSRSWRHFVIVKGLSKNLCMRIFPQLSRVESVTESSSISKDPTKVGSSNCLELKTLETEHRAYAFLARGLTSFPIRACISNAIIASSTDNYPQESIDNTLEPSDKVDGAASYWSSTGQINLEVPETLIYKMDSDLCVVTEINIQPFQAYFQRGLPIYSAKTVRFKMGHAARDKYVWAYTSEEFPMSQENRLQKFQLPEPVLCIGGYVQIELLGRVQKQQLDHLYYICVSHVQILGRSLAGAIDIEMIEPSDKFVLKVLSYSQPTLPEEDPNERLRDEMQRRVRNLEQMVNILRGNVLDVGEYQWDQNFEGVVVEGEDADENFEGVVVEGEDADEDEDEDFV